MSTRTCDSRRKVQWIFRVANGRSPGGPAQPVIDSAEPRPDRPCLGRVRPFLSALLLGALAACNTSTEDTANGAAPAERSEAVSVAEGIGAFRQICVATAPSFAGFESAATGAGLTQRLRNGGLGRDDAQLSAVLRTRSGGSPGCYVTFHTAESEVVARAAFQAAFPGASRDGGAIVAASTGGQVRMSDPVNNGDSTRSYELRILPL